MSVDACAALVAKGDPDRFAAVMAAPVALRGDLFVLYAFNLEVARAPWVSKEPMIAEMRLQWWRDVIAEPAPRAHEVAGPLHALIARAGLPLDVMDALVAARLHDAWAEVFGDDAALRAYLEATAGGLMWLAARVCGAGPAAEPAARALGRAAGMAGYLCAVPELVARGRHPLPDGRDAAVIALAQAGLADLAQARRDRPQVPRAAALAAWQAGGLLRQALRDPGAVGEGRLQLSEFARRGGLLWQATTGRW